MPSTCHVCVFSYAPVRADCSTRARAHFMLSCKDHPPPPLQICNGTGPDIIWESFLYGDMKGATDCSYVFPRESSAMEVAKGNVFFAKRASPSTRNFRQAPHVYIDMQMHVHMSYTSSLVCFRKRAIAPASPSWPVVCAKMVACLGWNKA